MIRGTTPFITYRVKNDFDFSKISEIWITVATWDAEETFKFTASEVELDPVAKTITISMSQENTLAFEEGTVEIQMRILDTDGLAYATKVCELEMNKILKDGVISTS